TLRLEPAPRILPISSRSPSRFPSAAPISSPRMPGNLLRAAAAARMREAQGGELEFFWRRKLQNSTAEIADLSQHHAPLLDLFPRATERADLRLTESQIRFFQQNGYLTGIPMLDARQLEALRSEVDRIAEAPDADLGLLYEHNRNESD